jgi:alpha-N-arabinofuranosidase
MKTWQPPTPRTRPGAPPPAAPAPREVPLLFFNATKDAGTLYLKVVNRDMKAQTIHIALTGTRSVEPIGETITLSAASPDDTNSITDPQKIVPVTARAEGLGADFTKAFPPYSITILKLRAH